MVKKETNVLSAKLPLLKCIGGSFVAVLALFSIPGLSLVHKNDHFDARMEKGTAHRKAKPKGMCRKCRFERFSSILADVKSTDEMKGTVKARRNSVGISTPSTSAFISSHHHDNSLRTDSTKSETPLFERMKEAYRILCAMRRSGEMGTYSEQIRDQFERGDVPYTFATYAIVVPHAGILFAGLLDYFSSSFDDFKSLSAERQQQLLYPNFELMFRSDDLFRSEQQFPDDDTFMPGMTTIFSIDGIDEFLSDCPPEVNKVEAAAEIIKNTKRTLIVNKAHFKRVQMSLEEFLAFLGLALWKYHASITDEGITEMAKRNRALIMAELHSYYAAKGVSDYSARLGDLLCLLISMEETASQHSEDIEVYKLMNMFNEYVSLK